MNGTNEIGTFLKSDFNNRLFLIQISGFLLFEIPSHSFKKSLIILIRFGHK
jgi:hypothetical protein